MRKIQLTDSTEMTLDELAVADLHGIPRIMALLREKLLNSEMMTEEILKLKDSNGCTLAYYVAWHAFFPDWAKKRKDILLLGNGRGSYVVHVLARHGDLPLEMMTEEILRLENANKNPVLVSLVFGRHLSPKILMLPWDEKTKVFEYLLSEEFRKQVQSESDMIYVKEQLEALLREKAFAELSVRRNHDHDYRRELER